MLKHYWISAIRNLKRNKRFVLTNTIGLSLGIAVFLTLNAYVNYHLGFDQFYEDGKQVFRIDYFEYQDDQPVLQSARTHDRTALLVHAYIPQVEAVTRVYNERAYIFTEDVKIVDQDMLYVDSSFFAVFDVKLIQGDPGQALVPPHAVVISQSAARQYFGDNDPMGKTLYFNERLPFTVTGVFEDIPDASSIDYDFLLSWSTMNFYGWIPRDGTFDFPWTFTYVRVKESALNDIARIDAGLTRMANEQIATLKLKGHTARQSLRPYTQLHFLKPLTGEVKAGVNTTLLFALTSLSLFVLIAAWINYINLSLAQSITRATEIGVRRAFGASRGIVSGQFFTEALIVSVCTFLLGSLLFFLVTGPYREWLFDGVSFQTPKTGTWILYGLSFILITAAVAYYPSYFMTRFKPVAMLRDRLGNGKGRAQTFQKALLTFQLCLAIGVVGTTFIAYSQISYMRHFDTGFNTGETISLRGPASTNSDSLRYVRYTSFRNEVLQQPQFVHGASAFNIPGQEVRYHDESLHAVGGNNVRKQSFDVMWIDEGYLPVFDLPLIAGRNFAMREPATSCMINETAARALGFENPSDAVTAIVMNDESKRYNVVGVIRDYHHESVHKPITPMLFIYRHPFEYGYIAFKLASNQGDFLTRLEAIWKKHYPNDTFTCYFMNTFYEDQYRSDELFGRLLAMFGVISVIISSLGLLGLASLTMVKRTKEIGVRKVLGASIANILLMLAKDYLQMIAIGCLVAFPAVWFLTSRWLDSFQYQTPITWWMIASPALLITLVSVATIAGQAIRIAMSNPGVTLREN